MIPLHLVHFLIIASNRQCHITKNHEVHVEPVYVIYKEITEQNKEKKANLEEKHDGASFGSEEPGEECMSPLETLTFSTSLERNLGLWEAVFCELNLLLHFSIDEIRPLDLVSRRSQRPKAFSWFPEASVVQFAC